MVAVILAPHPEPRRPILRVVVSTPHQPGPVQARRSAAPRRRSTAVYWRRRALVLLLVATIAVLASTAIGALAGPTEELSVLTAGSVAVPASASAASGVAPSGAAPAVYVVRAGDTVWSIAEGLRPDGDVRELVDQLTERAGGSGLQAGQRIALDGLAV